jgi:FkbM family methyltransferase
MRRAPGLVWRSRRKDGVDDADRHRARSEGGEDTGSPSQERPSTAEKLAETLRSLSPKKQAIVLERWPGIEVEIEDGVTITARSKKELRRLTRPTERAMLEWLRGFEEGEVFYDIGANCGSLTLAAAAMHRGRITIVAVEPAYANFESLVRNLSRNGFLTFTVPLQVALMERTGLERLNYYASTDAGTALHALGDPVDHEGNEFTPVEAQVLPTYALDDLIEMLALPSPTRVKIDVDGHEGDLLRGAAATLAQGSIYELAVEIVDHDRAGTRLESVTRFLERYEYELVDAFRHGGEDSFVSDHLFRRQ